MKKIFSLVLTLVFMFSLCISAYAGNDKTIDNKISSYKAVMDKVNADLGVTMYIPEDTKDTVYNNIKDMSLEEFETSLRQSYQATLDASLKSQSSLIDEHSAAINSDAVISEEAAATTQNINQYHNIQYNSYMFLDSTVENQFFPLTTGWSYKTIKSVGVAYPTDYTGYHFAITSGSYSFGLGNKSYTVTYKGYPVNPQGIALAVSLTETHTFQAQSLNGWS